MKVELALALTFGVVVLCIGVGVVLVHFVKKRHGTLTKSLLDRDLTVSDFFMADIDNDGFISKSEFVIYKLKEMGKVSEKDILLICQKFNQLDTGNCGKINLADLMHGHH